ncbi:hypothetical protein GBA63_20380 [Rubrobacter tropicus]|uniref:Uncharacterized protein n=1 Tax=Rubrobacter tropicus TaxID=2653851 RepID=A0A6G8QE13_9ACTN|nr:hypothetical protein [Rubrobacter tropicus]QIN84740.1 hypothetical protein GBA63_20380 [Rubrobacter tropicus]
MSDYLKVLLGAAGGALLALLLVGLFQNATGYGMMGGGMMGGGLFALLLWAALAALLVAAVVYVFTTLHRR